MTINRSQNSPIQTFYSLLKFAPAVIMMLFAALLFAFYAAPVANVILGAGLPNESLGNVYSMQSGILSEIPDLAAAMITLIVFAVIFFIASAVTVFVRFKKSDKVNKIFSYVPYAVYLLCLIIAIAIMAQTAKADEGMGIIGVGACPILIMVFSLLFALLGGGATYVRAFLGKRNPELIEAEAKRAEEKAEAERRRKERFYATHDEPRPDGDSKKSRVEYKYRKRMYDKAKEGEPNKAVVWLDLHKALLASLCVVLVIAITAVSIIVPILTNKFRANVVSKIDLGASPERVRSVLGDPTEETELMWKYYSKEYTEILQKLETNGKEQEKALMSGSLSQLDKLVSEEEKLTKQLNELKYDYIEIEFETENDSTVVAAVLLDKNRCNSSRDNKKEVEKVNILSAEDIGYYEDNTGSEPKNIAISYNDDKINFSYEAYFSDNSYRKTKMARGNIEYNGNDPILKWEDDYASYEKSVVQFVSIKIGEVTKDGVWRSIQYKDKVVALILPDSVTSIEDEAFRDYSSLTSITLPNGLTNIGYSAFEGCTSLQYEEYNGAKYLGTENNKNYALIKAENSDIAECTIHNDTRIIAGGAFTSCNKLTSITIPDNVISIGESAFGYCKGLTSVTIGENVQTIGESAFRDCKGLTSVTIGKNVQTIGEYAFYNCYELTSVTIPDNVTSIGLATFAQCHRLVNVTIGKNVQTIGEYAFADCESSVRVVFQDPDGWSTYNGIIWTTLNSSGSIESFQSDRIFA